MVTVEDIYTAVDTVAPFSLAMSWDNVGLLVGSGNKVVNRVLLAMDVTLPVLEEAVSVDADLIITHHPVIFKPLGRIPGDSIVYHLILNDIPVISAHTNLDIAKGGVNDCLANRLGLKNLRPLDALSPEDSLGKVGDLAAPMEPKAFAAFVKQALASGGVRYTHGGDSIRTVAVCGGNGADYITQAKALGAQALVTGEAKHDLLLEADRLGMTLVDAGHFNTETVVLGPLKERLETMLPQVDFEIAGSNAEVAKYL